MKTTQNLHLRTHQTDIYLAITNCSNHQSFGKSNSLAKLYT